MKLPTFPVVVLALFAAVALSGCSRLDPNAKPEYGKTGLPKNCRAYVQLAINGYRSKAYTAEESFAGLERNCGLYGSAWN